MAVDKYKAEKDIATAGASAVMANKAGGILALINPPVAIALALCWA